MPILGTTLKELEAHKRLYYQASVRDLRLWLQKLKAEDQETRKIGK